MGSPYPPQSPRNTQIKASPPVLDAHKYQVGGRTEAPDRRLLLPALSSTDPSAGLSPAAASSEQGAEAHKLLTQARTDHIHDLNVCTRDELARNLPGCCQILITGLLPVSSVRSETFN